MEAEGARGSGPGCGGRGYPGRGGQGLGGLTAAEPTRADGQGPPSALRGFAPGLGAEKLMQRCRVGSRVVTQAHADSPGGEDDARIAGVPARECVRVLAKESPP